jgi:hypothetical protein
MLAKPSAFVGKPSPSRAPRERKEGSVREVVAVDEEELESRRTAVELQLLSGEASAQAQAIVSHR